MNDSNYDGTEEIIVRTLKQPSCINAEIVDGKINYVIEKELSSEIVGDAKIRVEINDDESLDWDDEEETNDSVDVEKEINENVREKFL